MMGINEYRIYEVDTKEIVGILSGSFEYISTVCQEENKTRKAKGLPWITFEEIDVSKLKKLGKNFERIN